VVGGGTTVPEFQNSTRLENFQILSPSSIQINKQNFQKLNIKA
jgi:hypothetical protein